MFNGRRKILFAVYFFSLGLISAIVQMILLRETLISFRGNELFLTYFLIAWLILISLGSLLFNGRFINRQLGFFISGYYFIISFFIISAFLAIRLLPSMLHFSGEVPNLFYSLIGLPVAILPVTLFLGLGFTLGSRYFYNLTPTKNILNINLAYLWETGGFFLGSFIFNFWLVNLITFKLILFLIIYCLFINLLLLIYYYQQSARKVFWLVFNLLFIFIISWHLGAAVIYENKTAAWRIPREKLVSSHNSFWGNILVTERAGQYNFYEQGSLLSPAKDFETSEELVHLPLLFATSPQKILIIGQAWNGFLTEALKYPNLKIVYAEVDKDLLPLIYNYLSDKEKAELKNPRVEIINQDAYSYLRENQTKFDLILSNLAPPTYYQINRYYTREFFALARGRLTNQGVLAFSLPYRLENLDNSTFNHFFNSILEPLQAEFKNKFIIPGQKLIFLGFNKQDLIWTAKDLAQNFSDQKIATNFISPSYIEYLLTNERIKQIYQAAGKSPSIPNSNLMPSAVIYQLVNQADMTQPRLTNFLNWLIAYRWLVLVILLASPLFFIQIIRRQAKAEWAKIKVQIIAVLASSISLIWEIMIIFIWQITFGYIYQAISLIIGLIMLGIFLANLQLYLKPLNNRQVALKYYAGGFIIFIILFLIYLLGINHCPPTLSKIILIASALIAGYLAGAVYPLANYLYLEKEVNPARATGKIYGLELFGGGLILIIFSLFIFPFCGLIALTLSLFYWSLLIFFLTCNLGY